jgi:hypothetical protein
MGNTALLNTAAAAMKQPVEVDIYTLTFLFSSSSARLIHLVLTLIIAI